MKATEIIMAKAWVKIMALDRKEELIMANNRTEEKAIIEAIRAIAEVDDVRC